MTRVRFILRSFFHYLGRHLWVATGIALATAILSGALIIGDSMRYSLEQITHSRLGDITHLVSVNDRYFPAVLASEVEKNLGKPVAPLLQLDGMAVSEGGARRVNQIRVNGVNEKFSDVTGTSLFNSLTGDEVAVSENLARQLEVSAGDVLIVRIAKASLMPRNTPFVSENETTVTLRATIRFVAGSDNMGLFNLQNSQRAPYNLFLSIDRLNRLMEFSNRANRLLVAGDITTEQLGKALGESLQPEDVGLAFRHIAPTDEIEIYTERIFMEDQISAKFISLPESRPLLTYFVNAITKEGKSVPYSFAASLPRENLTGDEIAVNRWVEEDLGLTEGDSVSITWFEIGPLRELVERGRKVVVKKIVPMTGVYGDSTLTPHIPGISDAGHCREWEAGVPVDLSLIRQKDEAYWNRYRGTPKIFVSPELAREAWSNRFGSYTAVRFPSGSTNEKSLRSHFSSQFTFTELGFSLHAVKENGLKAARGGVDFGGLFLGLSFFLLVAAVLLIALLFRLNLENRISQIGTLLQLGFTGKKMRQIFMGEACLILVPGILGGILLAVGYVKIIFYFLNTLWWDIVRTPVIFVKIQLSTMLIAAILSSVVALMALFIPLREFISRRIADLHRNLSPVTPKFRVGYTRLITFLFLLSALILVVWQLVSGKGGDPTRFFLSGGMLLAGLLTGFGLLLPLTEKMDATEMTLNGLAMRLISRNRGRSMTVVILFALGTFLVIAVGANRQDMYRQAGELASGTGGFSHYAETAVPVLYNLNDPRRRLTEGLDTGYHVVQFQKVAGDDASCLNLNKIENPAILGFDAGELRGRFTFVTFTEHSGQADPWMSLKNELPGGVVPAIADQTVIQWGLMMKAGDTLIYQSEKGDTLRIKLIGGLAPSVFQGYILIDRELFFKHFPSHSGSSVFLIDPKGHDANVPVDELRNLLRDNGFDAISAPERLAEFYSVTNTYLAIFLALGILALALGTVGLAIVVARSILERRQELAVLLAVGFDRMKVVRLVLKEYFLLLVTGVTIGMAAAVAAVLPVLLQADSQVSIRTITFFILLIVLNGFLWIIVMAGKMVKSHHLVPALREL